MFSLSHGIAVVLLIASVCGCGRPPAEQQGDNASHPAESKNLPFDRQPRPGWISPSQSLVPSATKLPEGTPIAVRLETALSSTSSHAGDTFYATVDEPVTVDGQTLVARGTPATGRVLETRAWASSREGTEGGSQNSIEPGYLRIVLVSLNVAGKPVAIETSSIFAKGGAREERNAATGGVSGLRRKVRDRDKDVELGVGRHLNFRVALAVDLQQQ